MFIYITRSLTHHQEPLSSSLAKLFFSVVFILLVALTTSFVMTIVGDRVPDQSSYPPLPDIFLDSIPLIPIAFPLAESIILCECECLPSSSK